MMTSPSCFAEGACPTKLCIAMQADWIFNWRFCLMYLYRYMNMGAVIKNNFKGIEKQRRK